MGDGLNLDMVLLVKPVGRLAVSKTFDELHDQYQR